MTHYVISNGEGMIIPVRDLEHADNGTLAYEAVDGSAGVVNAEAWAVYEEVPEHIVDELVCSEHVSELTRWRARREDEDATLEVEAR